MLSRTKNKNNCPKCKRFYTHDYAEAYAFFCVHCIVELENTTKSISKSTNTDEDISEIDTEDSLASIDFSMIDELLLNEDD